MLYYRLFYQQKHKKQKTMQQNTDIPI